MITLNERIALSLVFLIATIPATGQDFHAVSGDWRSVSPPRVANGLL